MFNHYRDIRASGKFQKIWPRLAALGRFMIAERPLTSWSLLSLQNFEANFQVDVIFINKPHIWSPNKYILG